MTAALDLIALDADDTLWHTEGHYRSCEAEFHKLLERYHEPAWIDDRLYETEMRNLPHFGYGIKAFILSLVETAIELTEGRITGLEIQRVIELGRAMLEALVEFLDGVPETIVELARDHTLMIITKGDLLEQESKVERSGLREHIERVEIVSRKDAPTYARIAARYDVEPERFLMVGNSLRSDVLPVLEMGGRAVHIPYWTTWRHEQVEDAERDAVEFALLASFRELPGYLATLQDAIVQG
ncbi:MAG: HAD family hydrolase [Gemmatimonadota bacterium]